MITYYGATQEQIDAADEARAVWHRENIRRIEAGLPPVPEPTTFKQPGAKDWIKAGLSDTNGLILLGALVVGFSIARK